MNILKRFVALFIITALFLPVMIITSTLQVDARVVFCDIPEDYAYKAAVYKLSDEGIMDGFNDGNGIYHYYPINAVSRAEAVQLIVETFLEDDPSKIQPQSKFSDVPNDHWANRYITYATDADIISPTTALTFEPNKPVTYGEVIKMLVCAKGYSTMYHATEPWYNGYITLADQLGLNNSVYYIPGNANIPRAILAQLIYNAKFAPQIPKLYLYGNISDMTSKKDVRNVQVKYDNGVNCFYSHATIKVQGTSSLQYEKKNFTIDFYADAYASTRRTFDMGWGPQSKYCLKANWIDKSQARNVVSARIASEVQNMCNLFDTAPNNGTVDGFPVELYANEEFHGIYTFNIPKDNWMFNMSSSNPDHIVVCGESWNPEALFQKNPDFENWSVEVGAENEETLSKLTRIFDFVINSSDETFRNDFSEYLDLDSTINYYIMADVAYLVDNLGKNMLLATYDGQKWYPTLYDLDTSWGIHHDGKTLFPYEQFTVGFSYNNLFKRLEECFSQELADRYFALRKQILTKNNIMFNFQSFENSIPEGSFAKEIVKWGTNIPGFDISQIERYLDNMLPRLDNKYNAMK